MTRIIPRAEWGAKHRAGFGARPVGNLKTYLHHSVSQAPDLVAPFDDDYAAVRSLEGIGNGRFGGGISYTFAITPVGLIFEGHGIARVGAHTAGLNTTSAGIVLVGNYDVTNPPRAMLDAVAWLLRHGVEQGWWKRAALTGGHRDTKSTACPGRHAYAQIAAINHAALSGGELVSSPAPAGTPATPATPSLGRLAVYGSRGAHVERLQRILGMHPDGIFGPATLAAVKSFQRANGLKPDGQVGALTWAALMVPAAPAALTPDGQLLLKEDGWLGDASIARWQQVVGTPIDGFISTGKGGSTLVRRVQEILEAAGHELGEIDGFGIYPNLTGPTRETRTHYALQVYLGTHPDGVLGAPSPAVVALQKRLNAARF